ncbi:MAG: hypothetical protein BWY66_00263 [bacterium ADurb.Bin374]|nr:MAG: hypothetical protein BWY66_00263 [bacterium ADurb.Bin374]
MGTSSSLVIDPTLMVIGTSAPCGMPESNVRRRRVVVRTEKVATERPFGIVKSAFCMPARSNGRLNNRSTVPLVISVALITRNPAVET